MAATVFNKTFEVVGAAACGRNWEVPAGSPGRPGSLSVPPKAARELCRLRPDALTTSQPEAAGDSVTTKAVFTPTVDMVSALDGMTTARLDGVLQFLTAGREQCGNRTPATEVRKKIDAAIKQTVVRAEPAEPAEPDEPDEVDDVAEQLTGPDDLADEEGA